MLVGHKVHFYRSTYSQHLSILFKCWTDWVIFSVHLERKTTTNLLTSKSQENTKKLGWHGTEFKLKRQQPLIKQHIFVWILSTTCTGDSILKSDYPPLNLIPYTLWVPETERAGKISRTAKIDILLFLRFKLLPNFIFQCYRPQTWQFYLFFHALSVSGHVTVSCKGLSNLTFRENTSEM